MKVGMNHSTRILITAVLLASLVVAPATSARSQEPWRLIFPEQRRMEIRDPSQLPRARLPEMPAPATVSHPGGHLEPWNLSLDEAIRIALENADVILRPVNHPQIQMKMIAEHRDHTLAQPQLHPAAFAGRRRRG